MPTYNGARAQRALLDRQAEIAKQQTAQQAELGQTAADAEAKRQQNAQGVAAGYQQQATQQQAGIQTQRDATQFGYQQQQNTQQAQIQQDRDKLLIQNQQQRDAEARQQEARMQEGHIQGQMQIYNNQLSQGEILRLQRMKQGLSSTDEAVQNGTLTPEEGQQMRLQLQSGIDPLQRRLVQANIHNEQARTQAVQQQTTQQATEFNRRQSILAQSAQERMHTVFNSETGLHHVMQMSANGELIPLEMSSVGEGHLMQLHGRGLANQQAQQNLTHTAATNPLHLQLLQQEVQNSPENAALRQEYQRALIDHSRATTGHLRTMQPGELERQRLQNQGLDFHNANVAPAELEGINLRNAGTGTHNQLTAEEVSRAQYHNSPQYRDIERRRLNGEITHTEAQTEHINIQNADLRNRLGGNLSPVERRTIEHDARSALTREYAQYQNQMAAWRRMPRGTDAQREAASNARPTMPSWVRINTESDPIARAFHRLVEDVAPDIGYPDVHARIESEITRAVAEAANRRRGEAVPGMGGNNAQPQGIGVNPGPGGNTTTPQASPQTPPPNNPPGVGGGVNGARAAVNLPPMAASGPHPPARPVRAWRNLSAAEINEALTPAEQRRWHAGLTPLDHGFWNGPTAYSEQVNRRRDAIWAERER